MDFKLIPGNEAVKTKLKDAYTDSRVSHALLFSAKEGFGGLAMSIAFSRLLLCESPLDNEACEKCDSCAKTKKLIHPDLHFVFPVNKGSLFEGKSTSPPLSSDYIKYWREFLSKSTFAGANDWYNFISIGNKQGLISVKESEEIIKKLSLKSYEGGYKIMIIWMAEAMNTATSNKLLKILEEPPEKTVFMLITENAEEIIPTILSRTQLVKLSRPEDEAVKNYLIQHRNANHDEAEKMVYLADGNIFEAEKPFINIESGDTEQAFTDLFIDWMRACYKLKMNDMKEVIDVIDKFDIENKKLFLAYVLRMVRLCMLMKNNSKDLIRATTKEMDFIEKFHPFVKEIPFYEQVNKAIIGIERNGNSKIILMDMSFKITRILKS